MAGGGVEEWKNGVTSSKNYSGRGVGWVEGGKQGWPGDGGRPPKNQGVRTFSTQSGGTRWRGPTPRTRPPARRPPRPWSGGGRCGSSRPRPPSRTPGRPPPCPQSPQKRRRLPGRRPAGRARRGRGWWWWSQRPCPRHRRWRPARRAEGALATAREASIARPPTATAPTTVMARAAAPTTTAAWAPMVSRARASASPCS